MPLYPVALCVSGRLCVVIGGGEVAERKIEALVKAGAMVRVISPDPPPSEGIEILTRTYRKGDLEGAFLAIAATDDREVNIAVSREAGERGIPVNVVDDPALCTFFVPSVITRGELQLSISTGGKCPSLAKRIRRELEDLYGEDYGEYLQIMGEARREIIARFPSEMRSELMEEILARADILGLIRARRLDGAREVIREILAGQEARPEPDVSRPRQERERL
jgi:precorrin-2 dehydrogenase/sirohydrochlorin ferrochelatase